MVKTRLSSAKNIHVISLPNCVKKISAGHKKVARVRKSEAVRKNFRSTRNSENENSREMSTLALPTAPFSKKDPNGWFRQLEAIFTLNKIEGDETRFVHLQARIDPVVLQEVSEFFSNVPIENKYKALKDKIVNKYSESRDAQVLQLLEGLSLGNRRPSELLSELLRLAGADISEKVLRTMFLKQLPENLAGILAGSSEGLIKLDELADRIHSFQSTYTTPQISAFASTPVTVSVESDMRQIKAMLSSIVENNVKLATRLTAIEIELQ